MIWNHPSAFLALAAVPIIFFLVARSSRRRSREVEALFSDDMRGRLFTANSRLLSIVKHAFLFIALTAFVCVFAGPRYGRESETHKTLGRDIFVLLDVSDSMLAEDVAPNRLTVAKLDIEDLLDTAIGDRIGLVAFAGSSQVEIPLTIDYDFFRELLRKVDTKTVRLGGTAIGDAIRLALKRFGAEPSRKRLLVLITDGEDHDSLPLEAAKNASELNIPIITIAIGSPEGAKVPVFNINGERTGFKMFDGKEALSKPDVDTLKEISRISGGKYYYADSRLNLANVYKTSVEIQDRAEISEDARVVLKNRYQAFLAVGLISFAIYYFFPTRFSSKKRRAMTTAALIAAISFPVAFHAEAFAQEGASLPDKPSVQKTSKRQEINEYNESLKLAPTDQNAFEKRQEELAAATSKEVASRANFNLAVLELKKALKNAQELDRPTDGATSQPPTDQESDVAEDAQNPKSQEPKDAVEIYNQARQERESKRQEISSQTDGAARKFFQASQNKVVGNESRQNAEAVSVWSSDRKNQDRDNEARLRDNALPDPNDRLRWLKGDLRETIDEARELEKNASSVDFYRAMFEKKNNPGEYKSDVETIANELGTFVNNPAASGASAAPGANVQPNGPVQAPDPEGAKKILQAKDAFIQHEQEATKRFGEYDVDAAKAELRRAESQLATFHAVPLRYDALVSELAQEEGKTANDLKDLDSNANKLDDYRWSRDALTLSLEEMNRKARQIVDNSPIEETSSSPETSESQEAEPSEPSENQNSDDVVFDSNDVPQTNAPKSYEEKALESAKIALSYENELKDAVSKAQSLSDMKSGQSINAEELTKTQKRIAEILQEIVKPFQDDNQQNQNDQNQKNQNKNDQNQQDQDKNSQDQKGQQNQNDQSSQSDKSKDDQNQQKETPDELNEPDKPKDEEPSKDEKADQKQQETTVEAQEPKPSKEKKASQEEKTEDQKKAEELSRRVMRRQKDAEPMRNAVRQALKKREKSGKDW